MKFANLKFINYLCINYQKYSLKFNTNEKEYQTISKMSILRQITHG